MKDLPLVLRFGPGMLALGLFLLTPVVRAEDTAEKPAKAGEKSDTDKDGKQGAEEKARVEKYRAALARYDANHNGTLDPDELAKMRDDEQAAAKTENQAAKADERFQRKMEKLQEGKKSPAVTKVRKH